MSKELDQALINFQCDPSQDNALKLHDILLDDWVYGIARTELPDHPASASQLADCLLQYNLELFEEETIVTLPVFTHETDPTDEELAENSCKRHKLTSADLFAVLVIAPEIDAFLFNPTTEPLLIAVEDFLEVLVPGFEEDLDDYVDEFSFDDFDDDFDFDDPDGSDDEFTFDNLPDLYEAGFSLDDFLNDELEIDPDFLDDYEFKDAGPIFPEEMIRKLTNIVDTNSHIHRIWLASTEEYGLPVLFFVIDAISLEDNLARMLVDNLRDYIEPLFTSVAFISSAEEVVSQIIEEFQPVYERKLN